MSVFTYLLLVNRGKYVQKDSIFYDTVICSFAEDGGGI